MQRVGCLRCSATTSMEVQGRTLLASCLHEVSVALNFLVSRDEVDPARLGFIGHSYGGRIALWAPAFDPHITASVSN